MRRFVCARMVFLQFVVCFAYVSGAYIPRLEQDVPAWDVSCTCETFDRVMDSGYFALDVLQGQG